MAIPHLSFFMLTLLTMKPTLHSYLFSHGLSLKRVTKKKVLPFHTVGTFSPSYLCYDSIIILKNYKDELVVPNQFNFILLPRNGKDFV